MLDVPSKIKSYFSGLKIHVVVPDLEVHAEEIHKRHVIPLRKLVQSRGPGDLETYT